MSSTTTYINATADELRADVRAHNDDDDLYAVIKFGAAGAIIFGTDRPEDVAAALVDIANHLMGRTAELRAEAAGQTTLEVA